VVKGNVILQKNNSTDFPIKKFDDLRLYRLMLLYT